MAHKAEENIVIKVSPEKMAAGILDEVVDLLDSAVVKLDEIKADTDDYRKHIESKRIGIRFSITKIEEYIRMYNLKDNG